LGGGALMDVGCYCISLARLVSGQEPVSVQAYSTVHASGVDEMTVAAMRFPDGVLSSFSCGMNVQADNTAYICGTDGYIEIPVPWKPPPRGATFTIAHSTPPRQDAAADHVRSAPPRQMRTIDASADLYAIEADDFAAAVLDARPQRVTEQDSLGNMRVLDQMRRQIGVWFD
jgi:predicted dehydrogenase